MFHTCISKLPPMHCLSFWVTIFMACTSFGQFPAFNPQKTTISIPANIQHVKKDSLNTKNDQIVYTASMVLFEPNNRPQVPDLKSNYKPLREGKSPFELVADLLYAYQTVNISLAEALYDADAMRSSNKKLEAGPFNSFAETVRDSGPYYFEAAVEYKGGVYVYSSSEQLGIQINYLEKRANKYVLLPHKAKDPFAENMMAYLQYRPQPITVPPSVIIPDSLKASEKTSVYGTLTQKGNFFILFTGQANEKPLANIGDNYSNDENRNDLAIAFRIRLGWYLGIGKHTLYVVETNYPVDRVTSEMIRLGKKFTIKIKN